MDVLFIVVAGFVAAVCFSEFALKGAKLQTGLAKVVMVHGGVAGLLLVYFFATGRMVWDALLIFWSGAFLTWFGIRSHMESSILLRMLHLLRREAVPESRLLQEYESHYGEPQRLEELFRGGLLDQTPDGIIVTSKGKFILNVVSLLK